MPDEIGKRWSIGTVKGRSVVKCHTHLCVSKAPVGDFLQRFSSTRAFLCFLGVRPQRLSNNSGFPRIETFFCINEMAYFWVASMPTEPIYNSFHQWQWIECFALVHFRHLATG